MLNSIKSKCSQCKKTVTGKQRYTACSLCSLVFHQKCLVSNISINGNICVSNTNYMCHNCATAIFTFFSLTNEELLEEFFSAFRISASMLNNVFSDSEHLNNCDVNLNEDDINNNILKDMYVTANEATRFLLDPAENVNNNYRFSTLCVNARSIVNLVNFTKIEGLIASLDYKPDVIGITETWEQPNSFGQYKCLPGYIFVSNGRMRKKSGGVGLYIKDSLNFYVCNDLTLMNEQIFETIFINIQFMNKEITCGTI